jgi:hypothetical protein
LLDGIAGMMDCCVTSTWKKMPPSCCSHHENRPRKSRRKIGVKAGKEERASFASTERGTMDRA